MVHSSSSSRPHARTALCPSRVENQRGIRAPAIDSILTRNPLKNFQSTPQRYHLLSKCGVERSKTLSKTVRGDKRPLNAMLASRGRVGRYEKVRMRTHIN
jgi:hypothetical protein